MFQYKIMAFVGYGLFKHTGMTFLASAQLYDAFRSPVPTHKMSQIKDFENCLGALTV